MTLFRLLSVLLLSAMSFAIAGCVSDRPVYVVDGDTLDLQGQRVRLFGIDAPEKDQNCERAGQVWACGDWSRRMLSEAVARGGLSCTAVDIDRFGRTVAQCTAGGADLGEWMVQNGAATTYSRYSRKYLSAEAQAQRAGLGIWGGTMQTPEAFRHGAQAAVPAVSESACLIKGNINSRGERIYHRPGQHDYDATRISPRKGEAWFCLAAEAEAAGFRAARW